MHMCMYMYTIVYCAVHDIMNHTKAFLFNAKLKYGEVIYALGRVGGRWYVYIYSMKLCIT